MLANAMEFVEKIGRHTHTHTHLVTTKTKVQKRRTRTPEQMLQSTGDVISRRLYTPRTGYSLALTHDADTPTECVGNYLAQTACALGISMSVGAGVSLSSTHPSALKLDWSCLAAQPPNICHAFLLVP